jgi:thioredoxin reductase (NADPH)
MKAADPDIFDVLIVGGGPAGASAAIYSSRADLKTIVIDKGITSGAAGLATTISNYPGIIGPVSGQALVSNIRTQAESFGTVFVKDRVVGAKLDTEIKTIYTSQSEYQARKVILASGAMARGITVSGETDYLGKGVSYCATCDGAFFRDCPVAVIGNNDEALDEAIFLSKFASKVYVIASGPSFVANEELTLDLKRNTKIETIFHSTLMSISGSGKVDQIVIRHHQSGHETPLAVSGVFIYLRGNRPATDFLVGTSLKSAPEG